MAMGRQFYIRPKPGYVPVTARWQVAHRLLYYGAEYPVLCTS